MTKWARAMYQPNLPLEKGHYVTASKEHIELSKEAAKESMVLLKNENGVLPFKEGTKLALFGKGSFDYVKGGGGSGDVTVSYITNLYEGLKRQSVEIFEPLSAFYKEEVQKQYAKGAVPGMFEEPCLPKELLEAAKAKADVAVFCISRFSGEGWDRSSIECPPEEDDPWDFPGESMPQTSERVYPKGDFYLTQQEEDLLAQITAAFDKVVVIFNVGGVMDVSWVKEDEKITAALYAWQGGMEGGTAAAELLCGNGNPSGRLVDTFVARIEDYPSTANFHESFDYVDYEEDIYVGYRFFETIPGKAELVTYPFGYGLSYTTFSYEVLSCEEQNSALVAEVEVENTGNYPGKEVLQLYYAAPMGVLGKPKRQLGAFAKTRILAPGEKQILKLSFVLSDMASYDDLGKIQKSAYVLEKGDYEFYLGTSLRETEKLDFVWTLDKDCVIEQLSSKLVPTGLRRRMLADGTFESLPVSPAKDMDENCLEKMTPGSVEALMPATRAYPRRLLMKQYKEGIHPLKEVAEGKITLEEFMAQLSDEELIHLLGGQPNTGVSNTFGFGNLPEFGVVNIATADGPAGLRIAPECGVCTTAWPCATALAATWNTQLVEQVGRAGGREVKENNISVWLTPAVCIHRNPLCGRNFEYYSEDPLISGKMGAAMVKGIQSANVAATVKHFACNNKETNRKNSDSRVSERALREIYLKQFERIVREASPWAIMSSYNAINGQRTSQSHELLEDILRGEWNYQGVVTTDWWTRGEHYREILAGNDIKMACGFPERVKQAMQLKMVSRKDLERCAKRVLQLILKIE